MEANPMNPSRPQVLEGEEPGDPILDSMVLPRGLHIIVP